MTDTGIPNLPPELADAVTLIADNASQRLFEHLMKEAEWFFGWAPVSEDTKLGIIYLVSLKLTGLVQKKISKSRQ